MRCRRIQKNFNDRLLGVVVVRISLLLLLLAPRSLPSLFFLSSSFLFFNNHSSYVHQCTSPPDRTFYSLRKPQSPSTAAFKVCKFRRLPDVEALKMVKCSVGYNSYSYSNYAILDLCRRAELASRSQISFYN